MVATAVRPPGYASDDDDDDDNDDDACQARHDQPISLTHITCNLTFLSLYYLTLCMFIMKIISIYDRTKSIILQGDNIIQWSNLKGLVKIN